MDSLKKAGLASIVTFLLGSASSGCYINEPYVYWRLDTPRSESGTVEKKAKKYDIMSTPAPVEAVTKDCQTYAASYADSRRVKGRKNTVCTCHYPYLPEGYQDQPCNK